GPIISADAEEKHIIFDKKWGGSGADQSYVKFTDLMHLNPMNLEVGTTNPTGEKGFVIHHLPNARFLTMRGGSQSVTFDAQWGTTSSSAATSLRLPASSETNRSINAGGTVNTSGADYAEYMYKNQNCGTIQKGDIVGIDSNGRLTDN